MDASEYISYVEEQLRAYDFEEWTADAKWEDSCFYKETNNLVRTIYDVVVIKQIENSDVEHIKESIERAIQVPKNGVVDIEGIGHTQLFVLLIPSTVTKAERIAAKRGAGARNDDQPMTVLPVIVDLQNQRVDHAKPSTVGKLVKISTFSEMVNRVDDYFRV